jgi:ubiquinone/menaquinone biosynthesis C-methylase UbiE
MSEVEKSRNEGLIKDAYEVIIKELQTVLTVFYLLLVGIGMLFTHYKYSAVGINIFEYADVFDFLIAPFKDRWIIAVTIFTVSIPVGMLIIDRWWIRNYPKSYSIMNFGWDKKPWYNKYRYTAFSFLLIYFVVEGARGYGATEARKISDAAIVEVVFSNGDKLIGNEIGKTREVVFLMVEGKVRIIPIISLVKELRILRQRNMSDVMRLFDDAAEDYANKYWSVDDYKEQLDKWVGSLPTGAHVLDLGCGPGNYADHSLNKRPDLNWSGVDFSPTMIQIAKDSVPQGEFSVGDVTEKSWYKDSLQGVMISFVTPYLDNDATKKIFSRSHRALDPGGQVYLGTIVGEKDEVRAQPSSDPDGVSLLTYYRKVDTYRKWLEKVGFEVLEVETKTRDYGNESVDEAIFLAQKKDK